MSGYFKNGIDKDRRKIVIDEAVKQLAKLEFDAIICRGMSGVCVAPILAYLLDKHLMIIRKKGEAAHSNDHPTSFAWGNKDPMIGIILDDFVSSGSTIEAILTEVKAQRPGLKIIGAYFYVQSAHRAPDHNSMHGLTMLNRFSTYINNDCNRICYKEFSK